MTVGIKAARPLALSHFPPAPLHLRSTSAATNRRDMEETAASPYHCAVPQSVLPKASASFRTGQSYSEEMLVRPLDGIAPGRRAEPSIWEAEHWRQVRSASHSTQPPRSLNNFGKGTLNRKAGWDGLIFTNQPRNTKLSRVWPIDENPTHPSGNQNGPRLCRSERPVAGLRLVADSTQAAQSSERLDGDCGEGMERNKDPRPAQTLTAPFGIGMKDHQNLRCSYLRACGFDLLNPGHRHKCRYIQCRPNAVSR